MPNFEVLDVKIASALNRIIHNTPFKTRPFWNSTVWRFIRRKKAGPDNHRLKTMVKRSIEQNLRIENNYERNAVVKNQGTKQRVQRILGDCWQW